MVVVAAACHPPVGAKDRRGQVDGTAFEFSSEGSRLTDDAGSWVVRVRGDAMWVAWVKGGKTTEFGTFKLSGGEANELWGYIEDAELPSRRAGADYGPDTPVYTFTLLRPRKLSHTVTLRVQDARADGDMQRLVGYVAKLVRKYAHRKPRLVIEKGD